MAYSTSLQNFIDDFQVEGTENTYHIDNFTIVRDGLMLDGEINSDMLLGGSLNDVLWGNGGHDTMYGNGGKDFLTGAAGSDSLYGGGGNDRLQGWDEEDILFGARGEDALYGGLGSDELYGGGGNDYLCAGANSDELTGGGGRDIFAFRPAVDGPKSQSTYLDFVPGVDRLKIDSDLVPNGFDQSMIKVEADGDLCITTAGGHRMVFETLGRSDIEALYDSIGLI